MPRHKRGIIIFFLEPPLGFEPRTHALQKRCSTTELRWHESIVVFILKLNHERNIIRDGYYPPTADKVTTKK